MRRGVGPAKSEPRAAKQTARSCGAARFRRSAPTASGGVSANRRPSARPLLVGAADSTRRFDPDTIYILQETIVPGTTTRRRPRRLAKRLSEVPGFTQGVPDRLSRSRRRSLPSADGASRSGEPKVQRTRKSVVEPGGTLMLKCSEDSEGDERTQYAAPCFQRNCFSGSFQVKQRGFGTILCLEIAAVSPVRRRSSERATFERILPRRRAEYGCK